MARAWIYDRLKTAEYRRQVAKAKQSRRQLPMRWRVYWQDPNDPSRTLSELRRTVPEAEQLRDRILASLDQGTYRDPKAGREKLRKVAESWFESKSPRWSTRTKRLYREVLDGYVLPKWGATAVAAVEYEAVTGWLAGLYDKPGLTGSVKRKVGAARIQTIYHVLRSVMAWAVKAGRIAVNPIAALDTLPEKPKPKRLYLDHVQIEALAAAVGNLETHYGKPKPGREQYRVMVFVLAYCGLRIGEVLALRCSSVDLELLQLHVVEAVTADEDGKPMLGLPKGGKTRVVGIPAFLALMLKERLDGRDEEELVFTSPGGAMISAANFRDRIFRPAVKAAKLPKGTTPHTLRHSFASLSRAGGDVDVKTLQEAMGHASASITLDVYSDLFPARVWEVAAALGAAREVALAA